MNRHLPVVATLSSGCASFFCAVLILLLPALSSLAAAEIALHGFSQAGYSARLTGSKLPSGGGDFILGEERLQLSLCGVLPSGPGEFSAKGDFFHDGVAGRTDIEMREAYIDLGRDAFQARMGRQIITWGTGDLLFINDVFPKDWTALFAGRPLEYLKIGVDALKLDFYLRGFSLETVAIPSFEPDRLPSLDRFFLFDPFPQVTNRTMERPKSDLENSELSLRISHLVSSWDLAFYAHRGFFRSPIIVPDSMVFPSKLSLRYPRRNVYGASFRGGGIGGVVSLEAGYYDSRQDTRGSDPLVPNSQSLIFVGYQRQLDEDFTASLQYYGERMLRHDRYLASLPFGFPQQDEFRQLLAARLSRFFKYQTWKLSLFGYWSPTDKDFYLIPEVWHSLADGVWISFGGNVFGGDSDTTFFGQFDKNDNVYINLRYEF